MAKTPKVTLEELLYNEPRELFVEDIGVVKVRDPTPKDRMTARKLIKEHPLYDSMTQEEKDALQGTYLMLLIIEEPKIPIDQYEKCNEYKLQKILNVVGADYVKRTRTIIDEGRKLMKGFLEVQKES